MLEPEEFPEIDQPQVTNISHAEVGSVRAELVRMHQADAETITAEEVDLQNSAGGNVKATNITGHKVLMGAVSAEDISLSESGLGLAQAGKMSVSGYTGAVVAGSAEVHHGVAGFVAGREVHVNESRTGILLARTGRAAAEPEGHPDHASGVGTRSLNTSPRRKCRTRHEGARRCLRNIPCQSVSIGGHS